MEVFEMPVKISWTTILSDMKVGDKLTVSADKRSTVASRISREIKLMWPEREYPTDMKSEPGKMIIKRTA
ncbi:MAG: hypothetical protein ABIN91_10945 [Mucilaginibacter sp.]|uniref:hypothetical protein n=1 Tax=Mucilaginibacter sp. TaxID=1882438 RepID=UPI003267FBE8